MATDWILYAKSAASALEENGLAAEVMFSKEDPDLYDYAAGKPENVIHVYPTAVIIKNFTVKDQGFVDPEHIEVTFHSGFEPDTIPDLLKQEKVQLLIMGKIYAVTGLQAVRPAGITMVYKAKAKESKEL